jgi:predicted membrane-bound spermidine synthase
MGKDLTQAVALAPIEATIWVLLGIIVSLVLPLAVRTLQRARLEEASPLWGRIAEAWKKYGGNKYLGVLLSATLVAVVLVFLLGLEFYTTRDAALAGFAWESLINKLFGKSQSI